MTLLPVDEALARLMAMAKTPGGGETLPLDQCAWRILSTDLQARLTQPPFDASAMDGYAARFEDIASGVPLLPIGELAAGNAFDGTLGPGETVRIFTGAPVPEGADTVILQEDVTVGKDGTITTDYPAQKGQHIRPRGQDFLEGDTVIAAGSVMTPARLMVAAAMDHAVLDVTRKPKVGLLATGDELVRPDEPRQASQIIASNTYAIAALSRDCGADVVDLGIAPDRMDALATSIAAAREARLDVLVTLGGASVGDHDLVQKAMKEAGMELDFWRIAMRPGKPLMVGRLGEIIVLGLPGNPVSSMVCGLIFLEPLLCALSGRPAPTRDIEVTTATDLGENDKRRDHLRARLSRAADGSLVAEAFTKQDSSMMNILSQAGCLIVREPFARALKAGEKTRAILIRAPEIP